MSAFKKFKSQKRKSVGDDLQENLKEVNANKESLESRISELQEKLEERDHER